MVATIDPQPRRSQHPGVDGHVHPLIEQAGADASDGWMEAGGRSSRRPTREDAVPAQAGAMERTYSVGRTRRRRRTRLVVVPLTAVLGVTAALVVVDRTGVVGAVDGPALAAGAPATAQGQATGLDPELTRRLELAQAAAVDQGVELTLTSGWRSEAEQERLFENAVERYGSREEAARWVLPPEHSAHVTGLAIDVGPTEGAYWLARHGHEFGLCQVYANEIWHFEPLVEPGGTCPELRPDSAGDLP